MRAGAYRIPAVLQQPVRTGGADGSVTVAYAAVANIFVAVKVLRQREVFKDERLDGVATHEIRMRRLSGVAGGWRMSAAGRIFRILSVSDPDLRGRELVCLAEEEAL